LADVAFMQGNHPATYQYAQEALALSIEIGDRWASAMYLEAMAKSAAAGGRAVDAARILGAADGLREAIRAPIPPMDRPDHDRALAAARRALTPSEFAAAWNEGRQMTPDEVLATAARVPERTPVSGRGASAGMNPSSSRDELTTRELDVLRLLATGLTDAEVATRLVISPRTVHTHVSSIYSKLGVGSRSAATRYALDHHLL
jgi:DNA-binding CsgD family transcriptional regulator